jgi:hypothetical protein
VREIAGNIGLTPSTYFRQKTISRLVGKGLLIEIRQGKVSRFYSNPEKVKIKTN